MKAVFFLVIGLAAAAAAQEPQVNPVVELFAQRLELAKLEVQRQDRQIYYFGENVKSLEGSAGAVPERSIKEGRRIYDEAVTTAKILRTKVKEAEALLAIARIRVKSGIDMPLCSEKQ